MGIFILVNTRKCPYLHFTKMSLINVKSYQNKEIDDPTQVINVAIEGLWDRRKGPKLPKLGDEI